MKPGEKGGVVTLETKHSTILRINKMSIIQRQDELFDDFDLVPQTKPIDPLLALKQESIRIIELYGNETIAANYATQVINYLEGK